MTRAASSPELTLYRTPGKASIFRCAFINPPIIYRARINQTFSSLDQVLSIVFDGGSGTLANVLPDMEVWIGSTLDAHDKGICRLRDKDSTHFYLSETSEIFFANDDYVTILAGFGMWARPARILEDGTVYMDEVTYSNQHTNWDPQPNMGADRVLELVDSTVETVFNASTSFCPGSSISTYAWSCATASASSDPTAAIVTFQFDTVGNHLVYLTLTAANGKTFFGIRNVFVWDEAHRPPMVMITDPGHCDIDSGGWQIGLTLFSGASLADIHDRAKVILFSEDHYGGTQSAIGPVPGSENIRFIGWISSENHHIESEQGSVSFTAHGSAFWMQKIPSWPDGVELSSGTPDAWTKVANLTVDLGVYHWLRHRTTATRIMDVTLSGDTRISNQVSSAAQNLWSQLQDMAWAQIYARSGVNHLNQFSVQVHPSLIPTADRSYPTVMAITKADYADGLDFDRQIIDEVGIVDMSGIQVTGPNAGSAWFALAPGHSLPHYGDWDIQPNLLLASQAQGITLAGLYRSMRNNPFKAIPISFDALIALIDCFPNQRCTINIATGDNVRGFAYSGGLIPVSVQLVQDPATGYAHTEVVFEAQTSESQSRVGDTPGSDPTENPVTPSLPPIVIPPIIIPGLPGTTAGGPTTVIIHSPDHGFAYTANFDSSNPTWIAMNNGLTVDQYKDATFLFVCPNGSVYCGKKASSGGSGSDNGQFLARMSAVGGTWVIVEDYATIHAKYPGSASNGLGIAGFNPLVPETIGYVIGYSGEYHLWIGGGGTYVEKTALNTAFGPTNAAGPVTYGFGKWRVTSRISSDGNRPWVWIISSDGATVVTNQALERDCEPTIVFSAGSLPIAFMNRAAHSGLYKYEENFLDAAPAYLDVDIDGGDGFAVDPTGMICMGQFDTGQKGWSGDGGTTWSPLPSLPFDSGYHFEYAGSGGSVATSRWIAAHAVIRYSPDLSSWYNKEGNIATLWTFAVSVDMLKVVGY